MNDITKLPDGSAFFTAEIMSKDEAMKLPLNKRPICFRISSEMYHAVFEHIGEASMSWNPKPSNEVFDSARASDVAVRLCFKIANEVERVAAESFRSGQEATMKWVSEECKRQTERLTNATLEELAPKNKTLPHRG